jgi:hypothetical protein
MLTFGLRTSFYLTVPLVLVVAVVMLIPYDDSRPISFIAAAENCTGTCILGINPGTTRVGEALEHLQSHAWVADVELHAPGTGYGQISWLWSGQQPELIDDSHPGRMTFYWDENEINSPDLHGSLVETISIYTRIRMAHLQSWFGTPDSGTASVRPDGQLGYSAAYHRPGSTTSLSTFMPCPVNLMSYWNAHTRIAISIGHGTSDYVSPPDMVRIC